MEREKQSDPKQMLMHMHSSSNWHSSSSALEQYRMNLSIHEHTKWYQVDIAGTTDLGSCFIWGFENVGAIGSLHGPDSKFLLSISMEFRNVSQSASSQQFASEAPTMRCLRYGPCSCENISLSWIIGMSWV